MRFRRLGAAVLLAGALVAGCGRAHSTGDSPETTSPATSSAATGSTTPVPSADAGPESLANTPAVAAKLVTATEIGPGWLVSPVDPRIGRAGQGGPECLAAMDIGSLLARNAGVGMTLNDPPDPTDKGETFYETVGVGADAADAGQAMTRAQAAMAACVRISFDSAGQKVTGAMTPIQLAALGDESHGYQLSLKVGAVGVPVTANVELVRVGNSVVSVYHGAFRASLDQAGLSSMARKVVSRLA